DTLCEGIQSLILDNSKKSTIRVFKEKKDISTSEIFELIANQSGHSLRSFCFPPIIIKIFCRLLFLKKIRAESFGKS
ncbi:Glutamate synthase large subunit protein, partial [Candidatus Micropelagos thuwalensis]